MKYLEFINEAKKSELLIGQYVYFNGNVKDHAVKGMLAKITDVEIVDKKSRYKLVFDKEIRELVGGIWITQHQIRNLIVVDEKTHEQIVSGKLQPIKSSDDFNYLLIKINFKLPVPCWLDISYIDIDKEKEDMITYLPSAKVDGIPEAERYTSRLRQSTKIGRFFKKIFPDIKETDVERLTTDYRASWTMFKNKAGGIHIVKGEEIRYWYLNKNYFKEGGGRGTLWVSCMGQPEDQFRFNIYCENPDKIAQVIVLDDNRKLLARAMLWRLNGGGVFMDRIYSCDYKYETIMMDHARNQGWLTYNTPGRVSHQVDLNKSYGPASNNPYLDTFRYACKENGRYYLTNNSLDLHRFAIYTNH